MVRQVHLRRLNYLSAQCPFGTRPAVEGQARVRRGLNYLSAQCPFGTRRPVLRLGRRHQGVSITFRLSALSARCYPSGGRLCEGSVSITFRLSALSAQDLPIYVKKADRKVGLNYLSAQCPFGTEEMRPEIQATGESVSITFRLSALSAQELP